MRDKVGGAPFLTHPFNPHPFYDNLQYTYETHPLTHSHIIYPLYLSHIHTPSQQVPLLGGDGPSLALLKYMDQYDYIAPASWSNYRPLTSK